MEDTEKAKIVGKVTTNLRDKIDFSTRKELSNRRDDPEKVAQHKARKNRRR